MVIVFLLQYCNVFAMMNICNAKNKKLKTSNHKIYPLSTINEKSEKM